MQNTMKIIINALSGIGLLGLGLLTGSIISKKRYCPKKSSGIIYIDYTENKNNPTLYLENVDPNIFNNSGYAIFELFHIRK